LYYKKHNKQEFLASFALCVAASAKPAIYISREGEATPPISGW
jgi:hypothetical protein